MQSDSTFYSIEYFIFQALSILGIAFGFLLVDRPEKFADQKLRENADREIVFDNLENSEEDTNNATVRDESAEIEIENWDEDDIEESLKEYSEENFDEIANLTRKRRNAEKKNDYHDGLQKDIEVENAPEDIEPSAETKSYRKIIRYIKNEGIEGNP